MAAPFIKKHAPKSTAEIVGQERGISALKDYIINYKKQKKKIAVITGHNGCGKSAAVEAIAKELKLELLEINASDQRNANSIKNIIGIASTQKSFFSSGKVIMIDEIEGLSGTKDRGGISELIKVSEKSAYPLIGIANDVENKKFKSLRKKSEVITFDMLQPKDIVKRLISICEDEDITYNEEAIKTLARRSGGDLRAAINDLQTLTTNKELTKEDLTFLSERENQEGLQQALIKIFKSTDLNIATKAVQDISEDHNTLMLWLDENLPREYSNKALAKAYNYMSLANIYLSRIRRWQYWRYLVYVSAFLGGGIASSKKEKSANPPNYVQTKRLLRIWIAKSRNAKRKSIAEKLAESTHTSEKESFKNVPYIKKMCVNKIFMREISEELELTREEEVWLTDTKGI